MARDPFINRLFGRRRQTAHNLARSIAPTATRLGGRGGRDTGRDARAGTGFVGYCSFRRL